MTAGAVLDSMGAHELMTWSYLFGAESRAAAEAAAQQAAPLDLSVEDEIAVWR